MSKLVECKACNKEIAKGVKKCPNCGKDQRNWFMRHKIMSFIGIIIILGIIIVATSSGGEEADDEKVIHQIGDTVEIGDLEYIVTEFEEMDEIGDPEFLGKTASEGATLVAIQYTMKNISDEPIGTFSYPAVNLVDGDETEYDSDIDASASYAVESDVDDSKALSDLNPDITVTDTKAYEISKDKFAEGEWFIQIKEEKIQIK